MEHIKNKKSNKFYAYFLIDSGEKGIMNDWNECQKKVYSKKSRYKSFNSYEEANNWLLSGANYEKKDKNEINFINLDKNAIYFDAGTGRGNGVEVRLTDYNGNSLLYKILPQNKINSYGNYYVANDRTNNYGELVGIYAALKYALKYNVYKICGDSHLVIEYWSNGRYNNLNQDTTELIKKVIKLRKEFEQMNGKIEKISGDINPADLGFHK